VSDIEILLLMAIIEDLSFDVWYLISSYLRPKEFQHLSEVNNHFKRVKSVVGTRLRKSARKAIVYDTRTLLITSGTMITYSHLTINKWKHGKEVVKTVTITVDVDSREITTKTIRKETEFDLGCVKIKHPTQTSVDIRATAYELSQM
jgi:hypothetical protein